MTEPPDELVDAIFLAFRRFDRAINAHSLAKVAAEYYEPKIDDAKWEAKEDEYLKWHSELNHLGEMGKEVGNMPNWCENELTVTGENVKEIVELFKGGKPFETLKPTPVETTGKSIELVAGSSQTVFEKEDWWKWRRDNWGTKWDATSVEVELDEDQYAILGFSTAWSPPKPIIDLLREKYPETDFTLFWREPGIQEAGYY